MQPGKQDADYVHPKADEQTEREAFDGISGRAAPLRVQEAAENVLFKQGTVNEHENIDADKRQILQQERSAAVHVGQQPVDRIQKD